MRNALIILSLIIFLLSGKCFSQDTKPLTNFVTIPANVYSFGYYKTDSTVWIWKGTVLGWTQLANNRDGWYAKTLVGTDTIVIRIAPKDTLNLAKYMLHNDSIDVTGYFTNRKGLLKVDKNPDITPGTHTKISYDAKGLVTGGADATTADVEPIGNRQYLTPEDSIQLDNLAANLNAKVDKVAGKSLVYDTEIAKIHALHADDQDLSNLVVKNDSSKFYEKLVNKTTSVSTDGASDIKYPTAKAVKTYADAKVADAINDGTTTVAPSQNAVFDALAVKQPLATALTNIQDSLNNRYRRQDTATVLLSRLRAINTYQTKLTNPILGTGTTNYIAKWLTSSTQGDSPIKSESDKLSIFGDTYSHCVVSLGLNSISPLSQLHQVGFYSALNGNSYANGVGSFIAGFETALGTASGSQTVDQVTNFSVGGIAKGSGTSITRTIGYSAYDESAGTNNAAIALFESSFTGNWWMYYPGSRPSYLNGKLLIQGTNQVGMLNVGTLSTGWVGNNIDMAVKLANSNYGAIWEADNDQSALLLTSATGKFKFSTSYASTGSYRKIDITPGGNQDVYLQSSGTGKVTIGGTSGTGKLTIGNTATSGFGTNVLDLVIKLSSTYGSYFEAGNDDSGLMIKDASGIFNLSTTYGSTGSYRKIGITPGGNANLLLQQSGSGSVFVGYSADPTSGNKFAVNGTGYFSGNLYAPAIKLSNSTEGYVLKIHSDGTVYPDSPTSGTIYNGAWDASTNTPTLANGVGTTGSYYHCTVSGTVNFGAGNITFTAYSDDVAYNGSIWQKIPQAQYSPVIATASNLGVVKIGSGITVDSNGIIGTSLSGLGGIGLTNLSSTMSGLTYTNTTGVFSLTSGYYFPTTTDQTNWNKYNQWDGGSTGLVAATARTSLGLGSAALLDSTHFSIFNHVHGNITNTGYLGTTATIPLITGTGGIIQAGSFGTTAGTFAQGNDSRINNGQTAYGWGNHASAGYVTGTPWTGYGYLTSADLSGYATQSWVNLQGYVTGTPWTGMGYLTSSSLTGYATQTWVGQQGFVIGDYLPISGGTLTGALNGTSASFSSSVTASNFCDSDIRLKNLLGSFDITDYNKVSAIKFHKYNFKADTTATTRYGVVAQEVEKVLPELVHTDADGLKSVNYVDMLVLLVAQQKEAIEKLEKRISEMENRTDVIQGKRFEIGNSQINYLPK
jgi:hypothetical protein